MPYCKFYPEALCAALNEFEEGEENCPDPGCKKRMDENFKKSDKETDASDEPN